MAASAGTAQVTVTQAPEEAASESKINTGDIPSPCPMQIDVSLAANPALKRRAFAEMPKGQTWVSRDMKAYVCHTERIAMLSVRTAKDKKSSVELVLQPTVMSEQWRQDVNLTVSLVGADGHEYCRNREESLTVGKDRNISQVTWVTFASSTKRPEFKCKLSRGQYDSLFSAEKAPVVRIILAPELDDEDEEDDDE
jgi:hypothetical protein